MISLVVALMGTARPRPKPATAVLIPTNRARLSASAPPELPGLRAASVWMTLSTIRWVVPSLVGRLLPRALTTPAGTVPADPLAFPIADTPSPTRTPLAVPLTAGTRQDPDL